MGTLVKAEAMHSQQQSAWCVVEDFGGDQLFALEGNPDGILDRVERLPAPKAFPP